MRRLPLWVGLVWLAIGIAAGTMQALSQRLLGVPGWNALAPPLLASVVWVPITLAALHLGVRFRLRPPFRATTLTVHAAGAILVSFLLNAGYVLLAAALGFDRPDSPGREILASSLRWMHVNGGVYLAMAALAPRLADRAPARSTELRIQAEAGGRKHLLPAENIDWIEGAGDYARLHAGGREYLASERLGSLERRLEPLGFVRIHRSAIVNRRAIARLRHVARGDYEVLLADGTPLRASRRRRSELQRAVDELTGEH